MSIKTILAALALENEDEDEDNDKNESNGEGDPVAERAIQLATQHKAQLIFVHVIEQPEQDRSSLKLPADHDTVTGILAAKASERLNRLLKKTNASAEIFIETGIPHIVIDRLARRHHADLVVIGAGSPRNMQERIFGSTADHVVRSSPFPVLIIKRPVTGRYHRITAAVDFSATSKAAVKAASRITQAAMIDIIHAIEIPLGFEQAMLKAGTSQAEIDRYREAKSFAAQQELQTLFSKGNGPAQDIQTRIIQGPAGESIINHARNNRTELLALGTQGRNAIAQLILGSVARKVLTSASCDILVAPVATP